MAAPIWEKIPAFYHTYIQKVEDTTVQEALQKHTTEPMQFLQAIPEDKWNYRYAENKWSIKEMVQHLLDAERIFCYRALTFARKDSAVLPGFDENAYAEVSKADKRSKDDLLDELGWVQKASQKLFLSFDAEQLAAEGVANGNRIYVEAIGYIVAGHTKHHLQILKERYL